MTVSVVILLSLISVCLGSRDPSEVSQFTQSYGINDKQLKSLPSVRSHQGFLQRDDNKATTRVLLGSDITWKISSVLQRSGSRSLGTIGKPKPSQGKDNLELNKLDGSIITGLIKIRQSNNADLEAAPTSRKRRALSSRLICNSTFLSCKDRCLDKIDPGVVGKVLSCSCDPYCNYFKDCCHDYVTYCVGVEPGTQDTTSKIPDKQWSCRDKIWMITSCPKSWTYKEVKDSCTNITKMTHENYVDVLHVITPDNKTFANRFCAQCHGYQQHQMEFYPIEFKCMVSPPIEATQEEKINFIFKNCAVSSNLPKNGKSRRYCEPMSVETCAQSSNLESRGKCQNGSYGLVYIAKMKATFKNVFCAKCNGFDPAISKFRCGPGKRISFLRGGVTLKPFSLVLDIGKSSTREVKKVTFVMSCPSGKVYDSYLETCRRGQQLVPVVSNVKRYRVAFWIKFIGIGHFLIFAMQNEAFIDCISKELMVNSTAITFISSTCLDRKQQLYLMLFDLSIPKTSKEEEHINVTDLLKLSEFPRKFLRIGFLTFHAVKITFKTMTCVYADTYSPMEYKVLPGTSSLYINKTGEYLDQMDYFSNSSRMVQGHPQPVGHIVVCRQMLSGNCSGTYIFLQRHEYFIFPNRSLLYKVSNSLYEYGEYTWRNGTAMVCTNFTITYERYKKVNPLNDLPGLTILTYIGFSISVFCLVFVLVTYSLFPTLRTMPGINVMNLCCALLVAHLLWLIGSGLTFTGKGCTAIAIVLHCSFLASFMWMSIIAFDTWRAFSQIKSCRSSGNAKARKRRRIFFMMAIGWLPVIIYLSVCVSIDQSGVFLIGYGGEKGCWINNSWANLYFFAVPVALAILWNAVLFLLIVRAIRKTREQCQMAACQQQSRKDSAIYARIAVLMGFTWVFGFVAPFTSPYLMYPFVILNTLQGLYIAVAFCLTKRVRLLYQSCYSKNVKKSSSDDESHGTSETKF